MKRKYNKDVHYVCKLTGIKKIEKVYGKLKNYDVVLTDERINHIYKRRGKDSEYILHNIRQTIENYDYILDADDYCIRCIKLIENRNVAFVIKLSLNNKTQANSILSAVVINFKKLNKLIIRDKIIDTKHGII